MGLTAKEHSGLTGRLAYRLLDLGYRPGQLFRVPTSFASVVDLPEDCCLASRLLAAFRAVPPSWLWCSAWSWRGGLVSWRRAWSGCHSSGPVSYTHLFEAARPTKRTNKLNRITDIFRDLPPATSVALSHLLLGTDHNPESALLWRHVSGISPLDVRPDIVADWRSELPLSLIHI